MANEASVSLSLSWANGNRSASMSAQFNVDVTETKIAQGIIEVGTSAEQLDLGDITTPYLAMFRNHDTTNYIEVGDWNAASPIYTARLKAGHAGFIPLTLASTDVAVKANTAACELQYLVLGT